MVVILYFLWNNEKEKSLYMFSMDTGIPYFPQLFQIPNWLDSQMQILWI